MKIEKVYLDLDGVIADLHTQVARTFDIPIEKVLQHGFKVNEAAEMEDDEFWGRIEKIGAGWWNEIPLYEWSMRLVDVLRPHNLYFLTSPAKNCPCSASGKMMWLEKHFPDLYWNGQFVITNSKHLLADRSSMLIDDTPKKIKKFRKHGGIAICFPQPFNEKERKFFYDIDKLIEFLRKGDWKNYEDTED